MTQHFPHTPYQPSAIGKPRRWPWVLGIAGALVVGIAIGNAGGRSGTPAAHPPTIPVTSAPAAADDAAPVQAVPTVEQSPAVASGPATTTGDCSGCEVGVDLAPGRYKTPGPSDSGPLDMCTWRRSSNDSGEFSAFIAGDVLRGPGGVTLKQGEFVDFSGECTWTKE